MKKLMVGLVIVLALGAASIYLAFNYVGVIVKLALEHWGPAITGTSIQVGEVHISPRDGRGSIRGLEIGNPAGYSAARAARFGEIRLAIDPDTITAPVIVVREIAIEAPQITYERADRATNLDAIQRTIDAYVKRAAAPDEGKAAQSAGAKRRFVIERLTIRGGRVLMTNPALKGQGVAFDLPEVQLRDVGKRQGGLTASEVASLVTATLQVRIAQRVLTNVELLRKGGVEGAVDALKGLLK